MDARILNAVWDVETDLLKKRSQIPNWFAEKVLYLFLVMKPELDALKSEARANVDKDEFDKKQEESARAIDILHDAIESMPDGPNKQKAREDIHTARNMHRDLFGVDSWDYPTT